MNFVEMINAVVFRASTPRIVHRIAFVPSAAETRRKNMRFSALHRFVQEFDNYRERTVKDTKRFEDLVGILLIGCAVVSFTLQIPDVQCTPSRVCRS